MEPTPPNPPLDPNVELAIRRHVDAEMTRYNTDTPAYRTEAQAYRTHLETVFRNILYGLGFVGAVAAILFTYFFGKTFSDIHAYARAAVEERVLDYKVKEEIRKTLFVMVDNEVQNPVVRDAIHTQLTTLAAAAVAESAKITIAKLTQEQIRQDIARTLPVGSVIPYWGTAIPVGFELCDGELVTTNDSPLKGNRKPNLLSRFVRGAARAVSTTSELMTGGAEQTLLTPEHLPYASGAECPTW